MNMNRNSSKAIYINDYSDLEITPIMTLIKANDRSNLVTLSTLNARNTLTTIKIYR